MNSIRESPERRNRGSNLSSPFARKWPSGFTSRLWTGRFRYPISVIEYVKENDGQLQRRDLELATDNYRPRGLSEKARAGFQVYARSEDTNHLRRVRDREELMTTILRM